MNAAIIVLSDPRSRSEEVLGMVFSARAVAYGFQEAGAEVMTIFQGAGSRRPGALGEATHPANGLFKEVADTAAGVSCGCADVFGASEDAQAQGLALINGNPVPGTSGLPSLRRLLSEGYQVFTF